MSGMVDIRESQVAGARYLFLASPLRRLAAACLLAAVLLPVAGPAMPSSKQLALMLPDYPIPPKSDTLLFYLQRSNNSNTVIYEANLKRAGELNHDKPVKVYWIRYNTNGKRRPLKTTERLFAFGVESEQVRKNDFRVHLVSYEERKARVFIGKDGKPRATMTVAGRPAILRWAYVTVDTDGVTPSVEKVDLFGEDLATGKMVHEQITPQDANSADDQRPE
jgi:hypothetical protein